MTEKKRSFIHSIIAISALLLPVIYGLMARPLLFEAAAFPLEIVFLSAACIAICHLLLIGISWPVIQSAIMAKIMQAFPTILLLFAIGILIGSWMISGTIPLLVYAGLKIISPEHIYFFAFIVPIFFSICTGTSWGAIATIGLVLITIAQVIQADLAIVTGAIVGGAYFGDKISPLSDTTNIAAIAVKVPLYQHIRSMLYTTLPSAFMAAVLFYCLDFIYPAGASSHSHISADVAILEDSLFHIENMFTLNAFLLLPPVIIVFGSLLKKPPLPTLMVSSIVACILAYFIQSASIDDIIQTIYKGFTINMVGIMEQNALKTEQLPEHIGLLFNRGGLYALSEPIIITIMVFIYVGAIDCIKAIPTLINVALKNIQNRAVLISSTLAASALTNAMTSSQYANSFIVGEAFSDKYHQLKVSKKVLSRSLEDTGTMIESLIPWSTTSVFIFASLGVSVFDYAQWQLLSLINIPIAFIFALLGIGCFDKEYHSDKSS